MIRKKIGILFLGAMLWLAPRACHAAHIIFDLGGVLLDKSYAKIISEIGLRNFPLGSMTKAREEFFAFLDRIEPRHADTPLACDEHGLLLPQLMCDWLSGTKSPQELRSLIHTNKEKCSARYRKFILALSDLLFTSQRSARLTKFIPQGVDFVLRCIETGHDVYILSNWDLESFTLIYDAYPAFFGQFKGIGISGSLGLIKPDPAIFSELLTAYNLDPHDCVFIDDQVSNLKGAHACGIYGIQCKTKGHLWWRKPDFGYVQEQLDAWLDGRKAQVA